MCVCVFYRFCLTTSYITSHNHKAEAKMVFRLFPYWNTLRDRKAAIRRNEIEVAVNSDSTRKKSGADLISLRVLLGLTEGGP